jgi:uncharacterized protein YndB with AHSA1/START domain
MPEGAGETVVAVSPAVAFRYLADPRHAPEWFAGVALAAPPQGPLSQETTWRFTQGSGRVVPVRMAAYEPPRLFAWQTTHASLRSNLRWTLECLPAKNQPVHTLLRMTIRLDPGLLGRLVLLLTFGRAERTLTARAQAAAERARDALQEAAASEGHERPKRPREGPRRRGRARLRTRSHQTVGTLSLRSLRSLGPS